MRLYGLSESPAPALDRLGKGLRFGIREPTGGMVLPDGLSQVIERCEGRVADVGYMLMDGHSFPSGSEDPPEGRGVHAGKAPPSTEIGDFRLTRGQRFGEDQASLRSISGPAGCEARPSVAGFRILGSGSPQIRPMISTGISLGRVRRDKSTGTTQHSRKPLDEARPALGEPLGQPFGQRPPVVPVFFHGLQLTLGRAKAFG
jgi:hypothetical protein